MINSRARYIHTDNSWSSLGISLSGAGCGCQKSGQSRAGAWNRTMNEYAFVLLVEGCGILRTGRTKGKLQVRSGDLFMLFPGVKHSYYATHPEGWSEYWVMFSGPYADLLQKTGLLCDSSPILTNVNPRIKVLMDTILTDLDAPVPHTDEALITLFEVLACLKAGTAGSQSASSTVVEHVKAHIASAPEAPIDYEDLARDVGTSYPNLRRLFKRHTGLPLRQYQLSLQVNMAKELLRITDMSVKDVAYKCGFSDPYYFSRLFRQRTGVTPSGWKE